MLPRKLRLSRGGFAQAGVSLTARSVFGNMKAHAGTLAFGVVVSKKTAKTAVQRHFLRRRAYEALALNYNESRAMQVIWHLSAEVGTLPFHQLVTETGDMLTTLWSKIDK